MGVDSCFPVGPMRPAPTLTVGPPDTLLEGPIARYPLSPFPPCWYTGEMRLENLNVDSLDPHRLAAFWTAALGAEALTEEDDLAEIRVNLPEGRFLDLCFERVPTPLAVKSRVHPDLTGGPHQRETVERLLGLGATRTDIGQRDVPWVVLADPEGNTFCVMDEREAYRGTGSSPP